jgi:hypothetical protein
MSTHDRYDLPTFDIQPGRKFYPDESVYVIDINGYDIWEGRIKRIRGKHAFVAIACDAGRYQWIDLDRILQTNDHNRAIFEDQERIRVEKMYRELEEPSSDCNECDDSEMEDGVAATSWPELYEILGRGCEGDDFEDFLESPFD